MSDLTGRTVWVVEADIYDNTWIAGVYATAEEAMAAHPGGVWQRDERYGYWSNGLDWSEFRQVTPFVIGTAKEEP